MKIVKPNILITLAVDLGYSDLGCYGSEISTPNLDGLSENGARFTQFYNSARSYYPARAIFLIGLFPHQAGISFVGPERRVAGYAGRLTGKAVTLAEDLKENGYRTFRSGKWQVNSLGLTERGFEELYGLLDDYGVDYCEANWMQRYPEGRSERVWEVGEYFTANAINDYVLDFLKLSESIPEKSWFMCLAYQALHFPLEAPQKDMEKYKDTNKVGWDVMREQRLTRTKKLSGIFRIFRLLTISKFHKQLKSYLILNEFTWILNHFTYLRSKSILFLKHKYFSK